MKYEISADDLMRLMLLASHLDTDDEIGDILMRVSKMDMERHDTPVDTAPVPPAKPE